MSAPLLSHCFPTAPCSQSLPEQHRRRRRLRTRRHPQGDEDHQPQVRRRPRVFAFVSAPVDTLTLPPSSLRPLFAVSGTTRSETRALPRSPLSSRRRGSPTSSAPPPHAECLRLCQRVLTRTCPLTVPPHPFLAASEATASETRAPPRSLPSSRRRRFPTSSAPPPNIVFAFASAPR